MINVYISHAFWLINLAPVLEADAGGGSRNKQRLKSKHIFISGGGLCSECCPPSCTAVAGDKDLSGQMRTRGAIIIVA